MQAKLFTRALGSYLVLSFLLVILALPPRLSGLSISPAMSDRDALDLLLSADTYDRRLIPPVAGGSLLVNVSIQLLTLECPDESSLRYDIEFFLYLNWIDTRLAYDIGDLNSSTALPNISFLYESDEVINAEEQRHLDALEHTELVWLPKLYVALHGESQSNLDPVNVVLKIFPNGMVHYVSRRRLTLACQGNSAIFPFDDKYCVFYIESLFHRKDALELIWNTHQGELIKSPYTTYLNAYLSHNETSYCTASHRRGKYSCLKVGLIFNRDRNFYFTTVFVPSFIIVTSSFLTFWLEWDSVGERVTLGVTTMLTFFSTSNNFRSTLPVVSNLTAMNIWDGVSMILIYASMVEFVVVYRIGKSGSIRNSAKKNALKQITRNSSPLRPSGSKKSDSGSSGVKTIMVVPVACRRTRKFRGLQTRRGFTKTYLASNIKSEHNVENNAILLAKKIDRVCRVIFPIFYFSFVLFFFRRHNVSY